ncbi:MAG: butyrate kinase [bacterium]
MKILAINPGSTSTKISVYEDLTEIFTKTLRHETEVISQYHTIYSQFDFRKKIILETLKEENISICDIECCVGRGGVIKPVPGGVIRVNDHLIEDLKVVGIMGEHASNLGGVLAHEIASETKFPQNCFIVDPVVVDELEPLARYSGHPAIERMSIFHALNQKAVAHSHARKVHKKYEELNLIVIHLGGGVTVGAHKKGRVVDVNNGLNGDGPFSPERSGSLPMFQFASLCFSEKYDFNTIKKMITGNGGLVAYLGSNNGIEIEKMIANGDKKAEEVYNAMCYQIAKEIGAMAAVLDGNVDYILITGGLAYSNIIVKYISDKVRFIAPIEIYPGENEMQALAEGAYYALNGEYSINEYIR